MENGFITTYKGAKYIPMPSNLVLYGLVTSRSLDLYFTPRMGWYGNLGYVMVSFGIPGGKGGGGVMGGDTSHF